MTETFAGAAARLAELIGVDAGPVVGDEHVRWQVYEQLLADDTRRGEVLTVLELDPSELLVSAAVTRAVELTDPDDRARWLSALPPGRSREHAEHRVSELGVLDVILNVDVARVSVDDVIRWSPWLQLRVAERAVSAVVLDVVATAGSTRRIRHVARQRIRALK